MSCYILDLIETLKNDFVKKNTPTRFDSVKSYGELLEKSKINPAIAEYITGTSSGVMMVDSYEKLLELSKINCAVADNMTQTQLGLDLIDSYEKFLEITKINAKVTFNFQILNYQRYVKLVDSYQQSSQAKSLSGLNTSANSQLFFKKRDSTGQDRVSITTGQAGVAHDTVGLGLEWNEVIQNTISENMMNQKL
ncbi:TPA: hypothetical protein ACGG5K_000810 [Legionella pneumophila]|uniref:hypothetical protein n=2 Tax=Legionella pneumophila TaxID=446 RepID=UPI00077096DC|nr:hypothetical protein [Legionella pneumophila]HAT9215939.1 hypothetical protein [Legionella pneumophila subsp. pneumophila]CZJ06894.1 Uncharacterised protein [Legionella pneumophila]HAT9261892.1 hypothetical protein [Legionella pneumophila subsp. pneumophila]HAT9283120.1 hypothetical protein [Legionella pneumophila subsp. pneumophila]HAT9288665.1 hypothetical protein [Legionella pneumophila subsp. pneumophila]